MKSGNPNLVSRSRVASRRLAASAGGGGSQPDSGSDTPRPRRTAGDASRTSTSTRNGNDGRSPVAKMLLSGR